MLVSELIERVESTVAQLEDLDEYWGWYFGIRFENKERTIGEIITDRSKHNIDREDERDFPQFGSDEYEEMPELEGVCAWRYDELKAVLGRLDREVVAEANHCYLIGSYDGTNNETGDYGETVLIDPTVIDVIF